jgi:hypothetical protein
MPAGILAWPGWHCQQADPAMRYVASRGSQVCSLKPAVMPARRSPDLSVHRFFTLRIAVRGGVVRR